MGSDARGGVGRVAVVGGGVAGLGTAAALVLAARARGRTVDVTVLDGGAPGERPSRPLVLTPECRSRLAALGCRIPQEWRVGALRGVEVVSGASRQLLPAPPAGLWVVDGWSLGADGQGRLRDLLRATAGTLGVRVVERRVDSVERVPQVPGTPLGRGSGDLLVRAGGQLERYDAAVLATGAEAPVADHFFPGFEGAPTVPAVEARLRLGTPRLPGAAVARYWVAPLPGVDGLLLLPCGDSVYALGFGPGATPSEVCQVLMMAARDGLLEEGFELASLEPTRLPAGAGRRLVAEGQLAVGPAAGGHPLQLGVAPALASASRAASALLEAGPGRKALRRRYAQEAMADLLADAEAGTAAVRWLRRAGARAPAAFATAARAVARREAWAGGVLGLPSPTPRALRRAAAWAAVGELVDQVVRAPVPQLPTPAALEPDLYYVVDDDAEYRDALRQLLESQGAEVVCFSDELALYSAVARRPPTAILLDVVLQWVDGLSLCEGLKRHPLTRATRVVVMSGLNRPHVRERALRAGAEAFVPKPFKPEALLHLLVQGELPAPAERRPGAGASRGGPGAGSGADGAPERYASL
jgi:CheY-like chemotaxis protein/flavin-dependent dehydrogenase